MDKEKKIGIITCSKEANYGACLQAFATQSFLEQKGYDAEIINYSFESSKPYSPMKQKSIRSFIANMLFYKLRKSQYEAFRVFQTKMKFSAKEIENKKEYLLLKDEYDILLVGSDQVWNPYLGFDLDLSLLDFYDDGPKRISYASSFGISELPDLLKKRYRKAYSKFTAISTREKQGQVIIEGLIDKKVDVVVDPTMLFDKRDWSAYIEECEQCTGKYVLIYDQNHSPELVSAAKTLAMEQDLKIYVLSAILYRQRDIKNLYGISPAQFLDVINRAEYVITDSFHGVVFSVIFHKQFYTCCGGAASNLSSRITNLLDQLNLSEQWIGNEFSGAKNSINFELVDEIVSKKRQESIDYLLNAIEKNELSRSKDNSAKISCSGCGLCAKICKQGAIQMMMDEEGFSYPYIETKKCNECGMCRQVCPSLAETQYSENEYPISIIARSKSATTLMQSSSGGLFTELSDWCLRNGGAVYGAAFDNTFFVKHTKAVCEQERNKQRGSKYIQSTILSVFDEVIEDLKTDKYVLFTGTPCQCAAIHEYVSRLKMNDEKLILCDVICHGVTSVKIWKDYLVDISNKYGEIEDIRFRNKAYDTGYHMTIKTTDNNYHREDIADPYVYVFSHDLAIRPSCTCCQYKTIKRVTDITIGDFQKVKHFYPSYNDGKGVSVVLVNTAKGKVLFEEINSNLEWEVCLQEAAMQLNLTRNVVDTSMKERFMNDYLGKGYEYAIKKYTEENFMKHCIGSSKRFIKRVLKK